GAGRIGHLIMTQLGNQLGAEGIHVPYRAGGPLMSDAIANPGPLAIGSVFLVNPHVTTGRLRALPVASAKPATSLPRVETLAAPGVPGFEASTWWGVFAPGSLPAPLAKRIYDELAKAINAPAVREKLVAQGIEVSGAPGDQLDQFVRAEMARWAK